MNTTPSPVTSLPEAESIRAFVRTRYGAIAAQADRNCGCDPTCCAAEARSAPVEKEPPSASCCAAGAGAPAHGEQLGYTSEELASMPEGANLGLGCGNPLAIASLRPGETVLDLGSGAGVDCFLAARQLAGTGRVMGVDMTPAMVEKARANAAKSGVANVEFRLGEIEALPVRDASVDLILSNCVINLVPDKAQAFREAFRVLRPGGRLAIADLVATRAVPPELRARLGAIGACVGGAARVDDLRGMLTAAGFTRVEIAVRESSRALINLWTEDATAGEFVVSALLTAYKPGSQ